MEYRLHKLRQYVRGWLGYFGISEYYRPVPELDEWLRRRIRMCYWKQWRWPRTKISHLLALEPVHDLLSKSARKARWMNCKLVLSLRSQFFHRRRHFSIQAKDRSTTQRWGMTAKVCNSLRLAIFTSAPSISSTAWAKGRPIYPPSAKML